jgi:hypothetical protein
MTTNEEFQKEFEAREKEYIRQIKDLLARNKELQDHIALHVELDSAKQNDLEPMIRFFRD